jgi:hypothetical protein
METSVMSVTLDEIWKSSPERVATALTSAGYSLGKGDLANKVNLALLYLENGQLNQEDAKVVSHPLFKKMALSSVDLEDLKTKLLTFVWVDSLFNENNLLTHINDFNNLKRIYILTSSGLEVRNLKTLELEKTYPLDPLVIYWDPCYYKGKIYLTHDLVGSMFHLRKISSLDLESGEMTLVVQGCQRNKKIVRNLLYFIGLQGHGLNMYNMDTGLISKSDYNTIERQVFHHNSSYDHNLGYYYNLGKKIITYLNTSNTLTIMDVQSIAKGVNKIIISDGRIYCDNLNVYDNRTLELLGTISESNISDPVNAYGGNVYVSNGANRSDPLSRVYTYGGNVYVLSGSTGILRVYNSDTYKLLFILDVSHGEVLLSVLFTDDRLLTLTKNGILSLFSLNGLKLMITTKIIPNNHPNSITVG